MARFRNLRLSVWATLALVTKHSVRQFKITDIGKERSEVGRTKSVVANPCKKASETFGKFVTNAIGDEYIDPGKYNLSLRGSMKRPSSAANLKPFKTATCGNRKVKKSEFNYNANDDPKGSSSLSAFCKRPGGFYNKKTSDPFTSLNTIGYAIDPYELKEDLQRDEYAH